LGRDRDHPLAPNSRCRIDHGFELVTFVTNNLCEILEAIIAGTPARDEMITCHIDALNL
jgi:hypothetical protein